MDTCCEGLGWQLSEDGWTPSCRRLSDWLVLLYPRLEFCESVRREYFYYTGSFPDSVKWYLRSWCWVFRLYWRRTVHTWLTGLRFCKKAGRHVLKRWVSLSKRHVLGRFRRIQGPYPINLLHWLFALEASGITCLRIRRVKATSVLLWLLYPSWRAPRVHAITCRLGIMLRDRLGASLGLTAYRDRI